MKNLIAILILLFGASINAQTNQSRQLKNPIKLIELTDKKQEKSIEAKSRFTVLEEIDGYYKIYFWDWESNPKKYKSLNKYYTVSTEQDTIEYQRFFKIKKENLDIYSEEIYSELDPTYGVLTFPFKWRLKSNRIEPSFSLNFAGGVKWRPTRTNRHIFAFLLGIGPSSVKLDFNNSNLTNKTNDQNSEIETINVVAVTITGNLVYQFEFVQFGLSIGFDQIFENEVFDWIDQRKPWFSLGVGLNIFSKSNNSEPNNKSNK